MSATLTNLLNTLLLSGLLATIVLQARNRTLASNDALFASDALSVQRKPRAEHLLVLIAAKEQRLQQLEIKQSIYGISADPCIELEIALIKEAIADHEREKAELANH